MLKIITSLVLLLIGMAAQAQVESDQLSSIKSKQINKAESMYIKNATPLFKIEAQNAQIKYSLNQKIMKL